MTKSGQTICLCMIVKNENHVLRRCLESVKPLIDTWLIVDTGSSDGTQQLVRDCMADLPGELVERPWKDFGHNRSESLAFAKPRADYSLIIDADEYLQFDPGYVLPPLTQDAYDFTMISGDIQYTRIQLVRAALPWRFEGVLHEFLTCDRPHTQERLDGVRTIRVQQGARSRDPLTYRKDALILEEALLADPSNARHMYYLAQSYRDAGEFDTAIDRYRRRAAMGGFAEEVWSALYEAAKLVEGKGAPWPEVQQAYLDAYASRPGRAEPLFRIGMAYQHRKSFVLARLFLGQALRIPYPAHDFLFVESDTYRYLLPLEYAVACYWLGLHAEAISVNNTLLADARLTPERRDLVLRNRRFSEEALRSNAAAGGPVLAV